MSEFNSGEYEGWDAIPSSLQERIKSDFIARRTAEAELLSLQEERIQQQQQQRVGRDTAAELQGVVQDTSAFLGAERQTSHGVDTRREPSVPVTRQDSRSTPGGQDLASLMAQAMSLGANSGMIGVNSLHVWDGKISVGEDEQTKLNAYVSLVIAVCGQNGTLEVLSQDEPVKVGDPNASRADLVAKHSEEVVRKSYELWGMIVQKIVYAPISQTIIAAQSPQENTTRRGLSRKKENSGKIGGSCVRGRRRLLESIWLEQQLLGPSSNRTNHP